MTRFAILLPLTGIRKTFTYSIPSYFSSKEYIGHRAIVPFRHTLQAGIITNITTKAPDYKVLPLLSMPDATPLLNESQFSFLQWLSTYYLSSIEEAIPIALGSIYPFIAPFPRLLPSAYTAIKDQHLVDLLHHLSSLQPFNTQKIIEVLGSQGEWVQLLERLVRANAITLANPLIDTLPKQKQVSLATFYTGDDGRVEIKGLIGKKAKQQQVLEAYLRLTGASYNKMPVWIEKKRLLAEDISSYSLRTLLKKNIFIEQKKNSYMASSSYT